MKKILFFGIFALSIVGARAQSTSTNPDSIEKYHYFLMGKVESFCAPYISTKKYPGKIDQRIEKTERFVENTSKDTAGARLQINAYRSDSAFYQGIIQKADSVMQLLRAHDKMIWREIEGESAGKLFKEDEKEIFTVDNLISTVKDVQKQTKKRLTNLYYEMGWLK